MDDVHPLRRWRKSQSLNQDQAGDRLGVAGNTVARWERGEVVPQATQRAKISEVTGIPEAEILAAAASGAAA